MYKKRMSMMNMMEMMNSINIVNMSKGKMAREDGKGGIK